MSAALDDMIATLKGLSGVDVGAEIAREAAPRVEEALRATAAAGTTPEGQAWAPVKRTGARAMVGAAGHLTARAIGAVIRVTLTGPDVFHNFGKGSSEPRRRVLPDSGGTTPPVIVRALEQAAEAVWRRLMGGGAGR